MPYELAGIGWLCKRGWGASDALCNGPTPGHGLQQAEMAMAAAVNLGAIGAHYEATFEAELQRRLLIDNWP